MRLKFQLEEKSRANQMYILLEYAGGDADTEHPQEEFLPDINLSNYNDHIGIIESRINLYKQLQKILDNGGRRGTEYKKVREMYGDAVANLYEDTPNDPQADYQFKCYLSNIRLIAYDNEGNKYTSYIYK